VVTLVSIASVNKAALIVNPRPDKVAQIENASKVVSSASIIAMNVRKAVIVITASIALIKDNLSVTKI
jgi:hypothetical protein